METVIILALVVVAAVVLRRIMENRSIRNRLRVALAHAVQSVK